MWPIAGSVALAVSLLTAVSSQIPVQAAELPASKGSLVIIGGALRPDNAAVWDRIVQLAGGRGARIAVFASASANPEKAGAAASLPAPVRARPS
jgi:cyanophycinase